MRAKINGTELHYEIHGDGRPMLLMHGGLGLDHTYFRPWLDPLAADVQLIYYDHRGNGRSARPESWDDLDCAAWVDDADALRAHLGHDRILLLGHSFGAYIAQEYALRYGERLDGLILCSAAPAQDYPEVILANAEARGTPEQVKAVIDGFSAPVPGDAELERGMLTVLPLYFHDPSKGPGAALVEATRYSADAFNRFFFHCLPNLDMRERLHEATVKTLVLGGRSDWIVPPQQGPDRLHAALPRSELFIFERSGHFPFVEQRDEFASVVRAWLDGRG